MLNQNAGYSREKYREEGIAQHVLDENAAVGFVGNFVADLAELNLPLLSMKHVHTVVDSWLQRFQDVANPSEIVEKLQILAELPSLISLDQPLEKIVVQHCYALIQVHLSHSLLSKLIYVFWLHMFWNFRFVGILRIFQEMSG